MKKELITQGGVATLPQLSVQTILLDFDGELTRYDGEILTVDRVEVEDSGLTQVRIGTVISRLNEEFAALGVTFTADPAEAEAAGEYSTIYVGKTSAFAPYGTFAGLAETVDRGNANRTDKAFVMLDASSSDESIADTIAHEAGHLLGTLDHGGEGLAAYAADQVISKVSTEDTIEAGDSMTVIDGGKAEKPTVMTSGTLIVESGGAATDVIENGGFVDVQAGAKVTFATNTFSNVTLNNVSATVHSGATASNTTVNAGGSLFVYDKGTALTVAVNGGQVVVFGGTVNTVTANNGGTITMSGGTVNFAILNPGTVMYVSKGGKANSAVVSSGAGMYVYSGGEANNIAIYNYFGWCGSMYVSNGGVANNTFNDGKLYVSSGGVANSTTNNGSMTVFEGGIASATVNNDYLAISNGGVAKDTTANGGNMD
ncbi:MAG: hypothetical protein IJU70_05840, partial [Lentisphaeria bacterium]|nr:hypothetical protein [Lentisphaeria bacterium]